MSNAIFMQRTQKFAVLGRRDGEEQHLAPDWLLSPLLSGCYEMAPEFILKTQTGWGRAIRYSVLQRLPLSWKPFASGTAARARCLELPGSVGGGRRSVRIFEFRPPRRRAAALKRDALAALALERAARPAGLDVSNNGGYHSRIGAGGLRAVEAFALECVAAAERRCGASGAPALGTVGGGKPEIWLNASREGHWNRLHTHEGALWSGVFYAAVPPPPADADAWRADASGALLLKPTPHAKKESGRTPRTEELDRAPLAAAGPPRVAGDDACDYALLRPAAGTVLLFPGHLHHAVLPLYGGRERVSVAFNAAFPT